MQYYIHYGVVYFDRASYVQARDGVQGVRQPQLQPQPGRKEVITTTDSCNILPGCKGEAKFSLPLKRDKKSGAWFVTPVCSGCRKSLEREARAQGKTIQFYGLEGSKREAERRNAETQSLRAYLSDFAKPRVKEEPKAQPKLKAIAIR